MAICFFKQKTAYELGGVVLAFGLQAVAHFLPMPKELPIDRFFQTPAEAWILSLFGATFAPLIEELFFRGFLYPVLARRLGLFLGVVLTRSEERRVGKEGSAVS